MSTIENCIIYDAVNIRQLSIWISENLLNFRGRKLQYCSNFLAS